MKRSLVYGGILYFHLVDAHTAERLWSTDSTVHPRYLLDSSRVFSGQKRKWVAYDYSGSGRLGFVLASQNVETLPLNTALAQRFLFWPTRSDADTIDVHYTLQQNECGFREYRTIHILYNHATVYAASGVTRIPTLTFRK